MPSSTKIRSLILGVSYIISYINEFAYCCSLQKEWFTLKSLDFVSLILVSKLLFLTSLQQTKLYKKHQPIKKQKITTPTPTPTLQKKFANMLEILMQQVILMWGNFFFVYSYRFLSQSNACYKRNSNYIRNSCIRL